MQHSALFSTAYFPPTIYFALLTTYSTVTIEQYETYPKQTYRNRALILSANGVLPLSIPVIRPQGNHTPIGEITISYKESWFIKHWRAIESAYNSSPFFLYYKDEIENILFNPYPKLLDLNTELLRFFIKKLRISTSIEFSKDFAPIANQPNDFRYVLSPKTSYSSIVFPEYYQVFEDRYGFQSNLSILDVLFNLGPEAGNYIKQIIQ